jgi:hypothetical protein
MAQLPGLSPRPGPGPRHHPRTITVIISPTNRVGAISNRTGMNACNHGLTMQTSRYCAGTPHLAPHSYDRHSTASEFCGPASAGLQRLPVPALVEKTLQPTILNLNRFHVFQSETKFRVWTDFVRDFSTFSPRPVSRLVFCVVPTIPAYPHTCNNNHP